MNTNPVLQLKGIHKKFPSVHALKGVDFTLRAGEIHALLGENGAGKSTLIKVMTGVYQRDGGDILLDGQPIFPTNTGDAQALGISTVYQEVNLLPNLTVAQNIYLGREPRRFGLINWGKVNRDAAELLKGYDLDIDVTQPLSTYSIAVQQLIAIARGVDMSAKVLILDEPTASLDADEVQSLFRIMRDLRSKGIGIVFVTHFLDQVYAVCDRITILRSAELVGEFEAATLSRPELIGHMLGKELAALGEHKPQSSHSSSEPLVELKALGHNTNLSPMDLTVGKGEVVGLAGLLGSGRTELCRLLFAIDKRNSGQLLLDGKPVNFSAPREAIIAGMGLCPEDRKHDGILGQLSIRENMILARQIKQGWWKFISRKEQEEIANRYVKELNIATSDIEKPIEQLSGGNQQKVILARWLAADPRLLILDEPTRGIDIGAHAEIIRLIRKLCADGLSLVVASSELEELVAFSNKVVVLRDRKKVSELQGDDINPQRIMQAIASN
ncbi:putative ABC transporter [Cellvibrio sp. BR]|uniref:sugar ABC transporter ATP-binding protein n=1 Tax=Cellvibrio sp. BR TaxID=1134474 RepID=UPI0002600DAE|nr:sugar ABC transporter ATP-binding protein [Cellvibrio sp. BR]EIK42857.1 putative ABC transporter [Cellvibrio sp. BR]